MPTDGWLGITQAAELLGLSVATVRRWSDAGELPCRRTPGGQRRFRRADLEHLEADRVPDSASAPAHLAHVSAPNAATPPSAPRSGARAATSERAQRERRQRLTAEMALDLSSSLDLERVLETSARRFVELLDVNDCDIYRLDGDDFVCVASVRRGEFAHEWDDRRFALADWNLSRLALETRAPVVVTSIDDPRLSDTERRTMIEWDERSCMIVPMIARDAAIGAVELGQLGEERRFSDDDVAVCAALAGVAALAIQNADLYRQQTERSERLASLVEASRAISSSLVVSEVLNMLARKACESLGANNCTIFEYDSARDTITPCGIYETQPSGYLEVGVSQPLSGYALPAGFIEHGETLFECLSDPGLDPASRASMEEWGERSCLTVPLRAGPDRVGLMVITETEFEARYSDDDLELVRALGEQAAVAIRNARLFEDLEKRRDELAVRGRRETLVNELSRELSSMREVEAVLETTARRFVELFSVTACCDIYRLDGDSLVDVMSFVGDTRCHEWDGKRVALSEWHADRRVIETHEPIVVASPDDPIVSRAQRAAMLEWDEQCVLVVPMILKGAVTGTIKLADRREGRVFSPDEVATARAMAGVAALAIENAELYREQTERARRLASLIDAGKAITSRLVFDDVLSTVARTAAEALGCPECVIYDFDAAADTLTALVLYSENSYDHDNTGTAFPLSDWPSDRELLSSRTTLIESVSDLDLPADVRESMEDWGEKTCLNVPLYFGDQPLGVLVLIETAHERHFSADEVELATGIAEQAAIALHNARLVAGLRQRTDEAMLLNDVARASVASLDVADIAAATIAQLRRVTPFEQGTLLLEPEPGRPVDVVYTTQEHSQLAGIDFSMIDAGFVARLERERAALLSLPDELPFSGRTLVGLRSAAAVGLFEEDRLIGILVLGSASEGTFSPQDRSLFAAVGAQLSLAVRNARLYENVRRLHLGNLRALSSALTAKDYYTLGHTTRVAVYAVLLARELGLPEKTVQQVEEIAYLHDIGKIAVSDRVLLKPGALSDEEWELMRQHPVVSAEIIEPLLDAPLVAAVRHHHERYDGRGYPAGLAGAGIPELARLLCVVDCYDAMSSRRVYRRALTFRECVTELERCRGTQFDPAMVDAMVRMLRRLARQQRRAAAAAAEAAALIPARDNSLACESADESCPEYRAIQATLAAVRAAHPDVQRLVTEVAIDDRRRAVIVDGEARPELHIPLGDTGFSDDLELDAFAGRRQSATIVTVDSRGTWIASAAPIRDETGAVAALVSAGASPLGVDRLAAVSSDVSETFAGLAHSAALRVSRSEIDAITDSLTGLYNHRHLQERLAVEVALALETGAPLALLFADLDRFKQFNDRRGHPEGDEALRELARIVSGSIRSSDIAARYGGDQLAVVLHGSGLDVAVEVAERIRTRVEQARLIGDRRRLTVSIGVAVLGDGALSKDDLLQQADDALAAAKLSGRNRFMCAPATAAAVATAGR